MHLWCFVACLLMPAALASAEANTDELFRQCFGMVADPTQGRERTLGAIYCEGYLAGAREVATLLSPDAPDFVKPCLPVKGITSREALELFKHFVQRNPGWRSETAAKTLLAALADEYPCKPTE